MQHILKKIIIVVCVLALVVSGALFFLTQKDVPTKITYGMSFNTFYAGELGLDWKETYDAILDDLGVRHLRLAAHWTMVEPKKDIYNFEELDYQVTRAEAVDADIIFAVGRRLPRWPECHVPGWAKDLSWELQKEEIRHYLTTVVERYKDSPAVLYWQVENEPYLGLFANDYCGDLDKDFLREEIALVHQLDPGRKILVTDSGNLSTWSGAYQSGDIFGTSMYIYLWNPEFGQVKTILPPWFYRAKEGVMKLLYGKKDTMLIELSIEPWLIEPLVNASLETQFSRMDMNKFNEIIEYAKESRYDKQYMWGAEWWYWLKQKGHPEFWDKGRELFNES